MKVVPLTVMLVLLTAPAYAQGINLMTDTKRPLTSDEIEKQKAIDEAYKASINKIPDQQKSTDPWGNVRGATPAPAGTSKTGTAKASTAKTSTTKTSKTQSGAK
jgi:hypothetical protein